MLEADRSPENAQSRKLIHLLNNLLSVIQTQVEVARLGATPEAAESALSVIASSGKSAVGKVARIRQQVNQSSSGSASSESSE